MLSPQSGKQEDKWEKEKDRKNEEIETAQRAPTLNIYRTGELFMNYGSRRWGWPVRTLNQVQ